MKLAPGDILTAGEGIVLYDSSGWCFTSEGVEILDVPGLRKEISPQTVLVFLYCSARKKFDLIDFFYLECQTGSVVGAGYYRAANHVSFLCVSFLCHA